MEDSVVGKELIGSNVVEEVTDFVDAENSEVDNEVSDGDEDSVIGEMSGVLE